MITGTTLCIPKPHPLLLWPMLIIQNSYCFGLVILTIATADKVGAGAILDPWRFSRSLTHIPILGAFLDFGILTRSSIYWRIFEYLTLFLIIDAILNI